MEFRYFSCVPGCAVSRFGTDAVIGAKFVPGKGYEFDENVIVPIPVKDILPFTKEYMRALRKDPRTGRPQLIERTEEEYKAHVAAVKRAASRQRKKKGEQTEEQGEE